MTTPHLVLGWAWLKTDRVMVGRPRVIVTECDVAELEALSRSVRRDEADRARAILLSANGWTSGQIARAFGVTPDSVRRWRTWFMADGVDGLRANLQAGAAPIKSEAALTLAREVLSGPVADRPNWTLSRLQAELAARSDVVISKAQLSKTLKKGGSDGDGPVTACVGGVGKGSADGSPWNADGGGRTRRRSIGLG